MNNSRRRKQHTRGRTLCFYSIAVVAVAAAAAVGFLYFVYTPLLPPAAAGSQATAGKTFSGKNSGSVNLNFLYSPNAVLINRETGSALAENNSAQRIYPASLTKIMTAVLAIEHTKDLNSTITLPYGFFERLYEEGASMAGFAPGEEVTYRDLLYGILLPSGAECCMAFAEGISGSEEAFTGLMNQKAEALGMKNTHFCNCTGLHSAGHYSTVEDIAILMRYALENQDFRRAFTSSFYTTVSTGQHPQGFTFYSSMFRHLDGTEVPGGKILGGKTGFTDEAGLCLASLAEVNGTEYILVTAKANGTVDTEPFHILDAINVYNQIADK